MRPLADALRLEWSARTRRVLFMRAEDYGRRPRRSLLGDLDARSHGESFHL